jgi:hypothetical protein
LAQDEARSLRHGRIGTEHLLLGVLREEEGLAARVLDSLGVTADDVRAKAARIVAKGDDVATGQIPFTRRAKHVLELSLREAGSLGHNYIGTEHILLGLARENEGVAARILLDFDADAEKIRGAVLGMLSLVDARRDSQQATGQPDPLSADVVEEIEELRTEKEAAIDAGEFERAAKLRDRERRLMSEPGMNVSGEGVGAHLGDVRPSSVIESRLPLVLGAVLGTIAFPLGLVAGWLIWG